VPSLDMERASPSASPRRRGRSPASSGRRVRARAPGAGRPASSGRGGGGRRRREPVRPVRDLQGGPGEGGDGREALSRIHVSRRSPATRWKRSCPAGCPRRSPGSTPARPRPRSSRDVRRRRRAYAEACRVFRNCLSALRALAPRGDAGRPRRKGEPPASAVLTPWGPSLPTGRGSSVTSSERPIPSFSCDGPRAA